MQLVSSSKVNKKSRESCVRLCVMHSHNSQEMVTCRCVVCNTRSLFRKSMHIQNWCQCGLLIMRHWAKSWWRASWPGWLAIRWTWTETECLATVWMAWLLYLWQDNVQWSLLRKCIRNCSWLKPALFFLPEHWDDGWIILGALIIKN